LWKHLPFFHSKNQSDVAKKTDRTNFSNRFDIHADGSTGKLTNVWQPHANGNVKLGFWILLGAGQVADVLNRVKIFSCQLVVLVEVTVRVVIFALKTSNQLAASAMQSGLLKVYSLEDPTFSL
jgi:hypothetical protein